MTAVPAPNPKDMFSDPERTWHAVCLVTASGALRPLFAYAQLDWAEQAAEAERLHRDERVVVESFPGDVPGCSIFLT